MSQNAYKKYRIAALFTGLCLLLAGTIGNVYAQDDSNGASAKPDPAEMSRRIDTLLAEGWTRAGVEPAALASDAEFLRRAYLDLTGIIPAPAEVRAFLADATPDKRLRLIRSLLEKPAHATHLANAWRDMLLPGDPNLQQFGSRTGFQFWLRDRFLRNVRYDNIVAELLTTVGNPNQATPALFYTASELKPEELAARTARIFLGVQIDCAQCHDHPFDQWSKKDFWGYAAFFARLESSPERRRTMAGVFDKDNGDVKLPGTDEIVRPTYLGRIPAREEDGNRRLQLAIWLASRDNPYFARATVNRVWASLFGRGIVEPVDDLGRHNPPSHPQLLDELSAYFVRTRFDLRQLIRTIASTQAYQLSSEIRETPGRTAAGPETFARMSIKSLSADQLYDCLAIATRLTPATASTEGEFSVDASRQAFVSKFEAPGQAATDYQSGIPQALTLMNGVEIATATDLGQSGILTALEAPYLTDEQRVELLFLSTLSRFPDADQRAQFQSYVQRGGAVGDRRKALSDVLWALLNCAEFTMNH